MVIDDKRTQEKIDVGFPFFSREELRMCSVKMVVVNGDDHKQGEKEDKL